MVEENNEKSKENNFNCDADLCRPSLNLFGGNPPKNSKRIIFLYMRRKK